MEQEIVKALVGQTVRRVRYFGTNRQIAEQVAGDVRRLSEFLGGGLTMSPPITAEASLRLAQLERIFRKAFENCSDEEILAWSAMRLPYVEDTSIFGEYRERPAYAKEASAILWEHDFKRGRFWCDEAAKRLDEKLIAVLRERGEVGSE